MLVLFEYFKGTPGVIPVYIYDLKIMHNILTHIAIDVISASNKCRCFILITIQRRNYHE